MQSQRTSQYRKSIRQHNTLCGAQNETQALVHCHIGYPAGPYRQHSDAKLRELLCARIGNNSYITDRALLCQSNVCHYTDRNSRRLVSSSSSPLTISMMCKRWSCGGIMAQLGMSVFLYGQQRHKYVVHFTHVKNCSLQAAY